MQVADRTFFISLLNDEFTGMLIVLLFQLCSRAVFMTVVPNRFWGQQCNKADQNDE